MKKTTYMTEGRNTGEEHRGGAREEHRGGAREEQNLVLLLHMSRIAILLAIHGCSIVIT